MLEDIANGGDVGDVLKRAQQGIRGRQEASVGKLGLVGRRLWVMDHGRDRVPRIAILVV
jgi:hypothetical protein